MDEDRWLPLTGGHNFRDFGGYPTMDGRRVRRGMLFRSGLMSHLTADDVLRLRALGIVTVCDLRTKAERDERPTRWLGDAGELLFDDDTEATTTLRALLARGDASEAEGRDAMVALYRELPFKHRGMYRAMFRRLVDGKVPLLVNCSAGKDRTGVGAALVLRALGVAPDVIERDFLATAKALDTARLLADSGFAHPLDASSPVVSAMMAVAPAYLASAFAAIDARCGSFDRYRVEELGVDDGDLARMRANLLER
jgi:protein-tyrosine phosphatase